MEVWAEHLDGHRGPALCTKSFRRRCCWRPESKSLTFVYLCFTQKVTLPERRSASLCRTRSLSLSAPGGVPSPALRSPQMKIAVPLLLELCCLWP